MHFRFCLRDEIKPEDHVDQRLAFTNAKYRSYIFASHFKHSYNIIENL